ncbi:MAG: hypothetical protein KGP01_05790 [Actinomycetales bacterium]|nr:hypothetical protein [Actinomycetales bacterium]
MEQLMTTADTPQSSCVVTYHLADLHDDLEFHAVALDVKSNDAFTVIDTALLPSQMGCVFVFGIPEALVNELYAGNLDEGEIAGTCSALAAAIVDESRHHLNEADEGIHRQLACDLLGLSVELLQVG